MNSRIIAIANQKGGVGKTTTSINLAASLVTTKRRVLLIDLDPQGNATMGSGVDKYADGLLSSYDLLLGHAAAAEIRVPTQPGGYDLIPANGDLTACEVELIDVEQRERRLAQSIEPVAAEHDFVIIDCPPSLSMLTVNALVAAHGVLIPMQCEYYALEGLSALLQTIARVRETHNPGLAIEGILRTMVDTRNSLARDVTEQLFSHFGDAVYRTMVPRNVRLAEAPSHGLPVQYHDPQSRGAKAYLALAGELLRRHSVADHATGDDDAADISRTGSGDTDGG